MIKIKSIDLYKIIKYSFKQLSKDWKFFVWVGIIFYLISVLALPIIGILSVARKLIPSIITGLLYVVVFLVLEIIYQFYLFKCTLKNKRSFALEFRQLIKENKTNAGKFFLYHLLYSLLILAIFFVLPGTLIYLIFDLPLQNISIILLTTIVVILTLVFLIKYTISWQFYPYLLVTKIYKKEQIKFWDLLKTSEKLVKGRWWIVFIINILEWLIIAAFSLVAYLITLPFSFLFLAFVIPVIGIVIALIAIIITTLIWFIASFVQLPFGILYQGELFRQLNQLKNK